MKIAIIESPFGKRVDGTTCTPQEMADNLVYARACMRDSLRRNEAPYGSHLLYPQVLDDTDPEQRKQGMGAGFAIADALAFAAEKVCAVYVDKGITPGMHAGIEKHRRNGFPVEERRLGGAWGTQ